MVKRIIKAAPDYLPLSFFEFKKHFFNLITRKEFDLWIEYEKHTRILGYSCRALFEFCMQYYAKDEIVIVTTPIHHTSFRNIIEEYVKPENIHIIRLNKNFNGIEEIPELDKCDLVVITHLFGQDMDLSVLSDFKKKHNCIIIEDRVQGGTLDLITSSKIADIPIYSMGMDKRPVALGGGFMYLDKKHEKLIKAAIEAIKSLPREKTSKRFTDMLKKIPTFLLYNSRIFIFLFIGLFRVASFFNRKISLLEFTNSYRSKNPGFNHETYMMKPSQGLLKSMYKNFDNYEKMEKLFEKKYSIFIESLSPEIIPYFFPWYRGVNSLSAYNTIYIEEHLVGQFLEFLNEEDMSCIANPTYKVFNFPYASKEADIRFNNGIVYIPSTANMKKREIKYLANKLDEFYNNVK